MPWRGKSTKGAASRDSPRGGAHGLRSGGARMGEPSGGHAPLPAPESIGCSGTTRGTETSQYPEEEKSTEIPRVAASESGPAQTGGGVTAWGRCPAGVAGRTFRGPQPPAEVTKRDGSGTAWEGRPQRVRAPYAKPVRPPRPLPSRAGHVEPGPKQGGPPSKAKHSSATDSEPVP